MQTLLKDWKNELKEDLDRIYTLFPRLKERQSQAGGTLSGGEQQRVAIARALMNNAKVIFADEPTGSLDEASGSKVIELLFELNRENGSTLILVTHDPQLAKRCSRQLMLQGGRLV